MTPEIAICLAILMGAIALFAWDRVPADVVALGVMLALIGTGLLKPDQAFAGFGSDTVMMILGLLIMTAGLISTGVVDIAGRYIFELAGRNPTLFLPIIMASVALLSAFMSNTAATAFFVPLVLGYAAKTGISPSRFLLPVAFASILTSSVTLISTSTNLVVSELLVQNQQAPMGMFELAPAGIPVAIVGLLYMWTVGARLMPEREDQKPPEEIGESLYQADLMVEEHGPLVGKSLTDAKLTKDAGFVVVKLLRADETLRGEKRLSDLRLAAGDHLIVEGKRADLLTIKDRPGLEFRADALHSDPEVDPKELKIVEGVLLPRSPLIGRSLRNLEFKERYGLQVLAIHRAGRLPKTMSSARLRLGDVLLLQGTADNVAALERGNLFNIFGGVQAARFNVARAPLAVTIFALSIVAATFKFTALPVAVLGGAFAMLLTRCISPDEAYAQVEWKVIVLIGALLSLGAAMDTSGTGKYLAAQLIGSDGPYRLLTCFFLLTVALTQPMSNQSAAVVVLPIAIQTGLQLGVDPRGFAMMVAVAASCSYLTPLEPSCLMVYGPGKYRFSDFARVGFPLTVLIFVVSVLLVPMVWPVTR
jgi:di/tricarboxylate transporter